MQISDRVYLILADGTPFYNKYEQLVGPISSSLVPSRAYEVAEEQITEPTLAQPLVNGINPLFSVYTDQPYQPTTSITI